MTYTRLLLIRDDQTPERTYGSLYGFESDGCPADEGEFLCYTLEEPWQDNERQISCIPPGSYNFRRHISSRLGECFAIEPVPKRSAIRIHSGNTLEDISGCVLVGRSKSKWGESPVILYSKAALTYLLKVCAKSGVIEIVDAPSNSGVKQDGA
jgi:hypothetical protein